VTLRVDRPWRRRLPLLALVGLALVGIALGASCWDPGLLDLLPPLSLVAVMLVWPYPGADLIEGILRRRRRRPRPAPMLAPRPRAPRSTPHGGRLISLSLGGRAPPLGLGCA
jgi:hypothetical protein